MEELINYLIKNGVEIGLSEQLAKMFKKVVYQPGDIILRAGENTQKICFIIKGIVRGYYIDLDGKEMTKCFSAEKSWCCVYNFLKSGESKYFIDALEECTIAQIDVNSVRKMIEHEKSIQRLYAKLFEENMIQTDERGKDFLLLQAKDRYLEFLKRYSDIEKRVKQEYIASYIGITPSSLSRIKRCL